MTRSERRRRGVESALVLGGAAASILLGFGFFPLLLILVVLSGGHLIPWAIQPRVREGIPRATRGAALVFYALVTLGVLGAFLELSRLADSSSREFLFVSALGVSLVELLVIFRWNSAATANALLDELRRPTAGGKVVVAVLAGLAVMGVGLGSRAILGDALTAIPPGSTDELGPGVPLWAALGATFVSLLFVLHFLCNNLVREWSCRTTGLVGMTALLLLEFELVAPTWQLVTILVSAPVVSFAFLRCRSALWLPAFVALAIVLPPALLLN